MHCYMRDVSNVQVTVLSSCSRLTFILISGFENLRGANRSGPCGFSS